MEITLFVWIPMLNVTAIPIPEVVPTPTEYFGLKYTKSSKSDLKYSDDTLIVQESGIKLTDVVSL